MIVHSFCDIHLFAIFHAETVICHPDLETAPLLVLANKQDRMVCLNACILCMDACVMQLLCLMFGVDVWILIQEYKY